jgi:hypothetical protein
MPLVFGFNFNSLAINHTTFGGGRIYQLFAILKRNPESAINLNTLKFWKIIGLDCFSDTKSLVLWVDSV